jgi:hypothetical protein
MSENYLKTIFLGVCPNNGGGIPEAPSDGIYARTGQNGGEWVKLIESSDCVFEQEEPLTEWRVEHNLGKKPVNVIIINSFGNRVYGYEDWQSSNFDVVVIKFHEAQSGTAYIFAMY